MLSPGEDGGAFAECFFAQYPLGMGRKSIPTNVATASAAAKSLMKITNGENNESKVYTGGVQAIASSMNNNMNNNLFSSSSSSSPLAAASAGILVAASSTSTSSSMIISHPAASNEEKVLAKTTERTKEALEQVLQNRQVQEEDFSGRNIKRVTKNKNLLEISLPGDIGATGQYDPAPIVRSPTKIKTNLKKIIGTSTITTTTTTTTTSNNNNTNSADNDNNESKVSGTSTDNNVVVPFSIGNWKNKRKLIIPLEQRLAQRSEIDNINSNTGISDHVMQLAIAMQEAKKEVEAEQAAREKAQQEEEERRQAEREAEATQRARELLEKTATDMLNSSTQRKRETREERLERIRLERELREREKQQEVRQRRLTKAAARLGITLEALEADEELLKTVDDAAAHIGANIDSRHSINNHHISSSISTTKTIVSGKQENLAENEHIPSLYTDDNIEEDTEGNGRHPAAAGTLRKGVFGSAVISNEGIRREMEALAKMEEEEKRGVGIMKDGIRLAGDKKNNNNNKNNEGSSDEDDDDDEDDGLGMDKIMKKKRRL